MSKPTRCEFGFDSNTGLWIDPRKDGRDRANDRCNRQAGHPAQGGHVLDCGGSFNNNGEMIHHNPDRWFATWVTDVRLGRTVFLRKDMLDDVKEEAAR